MVYVIYIAVFNIGSNLGVYLLRKTQIAYLKVHKAFKKVFNKYTNFIDVFSLKLTIKILKYININNYIIELIDYK